MHIGRGGAAVAVTIHGEVVHHADIKDVVSHVIIHGFSRFRHSLQKFILSAAAPTGGTMSAGVLKQFSGRAGNANGDILDRSAKTAYCMALEVGQHHIEIIIGKMPAYNILCQAFPALHRNAHIAVLIQNLHRSNRGKSVVLRCLIVEGGAGPTSTIGGIAVHNRPVHLLNQLLD